MNHRIALFFGGIMIGLYILSTILQFSTNSPPTVESVLELALGIVLTATGFLTND